MAKLAANQHELKEWYLSNFNTFTRHLNGKGNGPFQTIRQSAIDTFSELDFPTRRSEEWKYTNISPILKHKFRFAGEAGSIAAERLEPFLFQGMAENLLVFLNGRYVKELSTFAADNKNVVVESLGTGLQRKDPLLSQYLGSIVDGESSIFTALNTAFTIDGAFIHVPDNTTVEKPLHLLFLADAQEEPLFYNPRNLILLGRNSELKIVESYHALSDKVYFTNMVTEIRLEKNARSTHVKIQDEHQKAYHISSLQVEQVAESKYALVNVDMGGAITRNNLNIKLDAPNCEAHIIGFYMGTGKQVVDNHTFIDHARPHCLSNELYKGILGGKAQGVFNGKVYVRQDAQKTNAYQTNQALLLSESARVNSKPELEIYADDVKCSHGATVGQLDKEALFYLRSRGIPREKACSILQYAFAGDVFEHIDIETVKNKLEAIVFERFKEL